MSQFGFAVRVSALFLAASIGGCSLIVDFDRRLVDPLTDGGVDAGPDGAFDAEGEAAAEASSDAD